MKKKFLLLFFIGIILLASILRFYRLGQVPPSPNWDEVSLGYNAYSILQTGKDEYGVFLPLILRSYDDYKPALYTYCIIPFIKIFGLNVLSVRLPSAIFGILTVVATYFLAKELFRKNFFLPYLTSFLLAISPWHIQFSRIAFESNVGLSFNIFSLLTFLVGLRRPIFLLLSSLLMATNLYVYQSEKVFTPLLLFILVAIFRKELFFLPKKYIYSAIVIGCLISLPLLINTAFNKETFARAKGVSVFSDQTEFLKTNVSRVITDRESNDKIGLILDNRRFLYLKAIIAGYISHIDLNWLFINGDIARHHAPGMGLLYLWELPFLFIGIYSLLFGNFELKSKKVIFFWFLITPIPASITSGVPHAVRTLNFLPTFQIFVAVGIYTTFMYLKNLIKENLIKNVGMVLFLSVVLFNFAYYLDQYFIQQNYFNSIEWQFGYGGAVSHLKTVQHRYKKVVVTNLAPLDQSYMFFLFYLQYPPSLYQKEARLASGGFRENHSYGKYDFRPIDWRKEEKSSKILYIGRPGDFSEDAKLLKTIYYLDGNPAIKLIEG